MRYPTIESERLTELLSQISLTVRDAQGQLRVVEIQDRLPDEPFILSQQELGRPISGLRHACSVTIYSPIVGGDYHVVLSEIFAQLEHPIQQNEVAETKKHLHRIRFIEIPGYIARLYSENCFRFTVKLLKPA